MVAAQEYHIIIAIAAMIKPLKIWKDKSTKINKLKLVQTLNFSIALYVSTCWVLNTWNNGHKEKKFFWNVMLQDDVVDLLNITPHF